MLKKLNSPLVALWLTVFIDLLGLGIVIPIFAALFFIPGAVFFGLEADLGGIHLSTSVIYGLLLAAYPFAQFIASPILGDLSDKYGRKKLLVLSIAGTLSAYIMTAISVMTGNFWLMIIARAWDGFTGGNISVAQSAVADISTPETKAKNFGLLGMAFGFGFVIGPYIGGKLSDPAVVSWFSFATPFIFSAILTLINICLIAFNLTETASLDNSRKINLLGAFSNIQRAIQLEKVRDILLVTFLFVFGFNFFTQFFQVYLIEYFSYTQSQIGDLFAYVGIWIALTQGFFLRKLLVRYQPNQIARVSLLALSIAFVVLIIPKQAWALWVTIPFIAIFNGLTQPNLITMTSDLADKKTQGEILGIGQSVQSLAQTIPPLVAGFVNSIHPNLPTLVAAGVIFVSWLAYLSFLRAQKISWHQ
ncbi:MFS transporter [candidate division WWE3 bacterium]|uniref:MFS transporter n=1 Tax=candidate division WWE3 bacterium TaxID=2053526 RepID=A0A955LHF9_UNCKA|nr:MFS transporter [candidate division WWE3 bacterium]